MSRVEIEFPNDTHFETELSVRIGNVNQGNHLGHDQLISLLHEARVQFFRSLGFDELDVEGVGTVIADLAVSYANEAFYGDKLLFEIAVDGVSVRSCQFIYRVTNVKKGQLIAKAKTGIVFFDYALRKSTSIPEVFISQLHRR